MERLDKAVAAASKGAQYAWPKVVAYNLWVTVGTCIAFFTALIIFSAILIFCYKMYWKIEKERHDDDSNMVFMVIGVIAGLASAFIFIGAFCVLPETIATIASPEAAVIMKFINK